MLSSDMPYPAHTPNVIGVVLPEEVAAYDKLSDLLAGARNEGGDESMRKALKAVDEARAQGKITAEQCAALHYEKGYWHPDG
jgi:hypothetical protein